MSDDPISDDRCELLVEGDALEAVLAQTATEFARRNVEPLAAGELDRLPALAIESDPAAALHRLLEQVVELAESEGFAVQGVDKLKFEAGELRAVLVGVTAPSRIRGRATADVSVRRGDLGWTSRVISKRQLAV